MCRKPWWDHHRCAGAAARRSGGCQGSPKQSITNQFEPGIGISTRDHWPDDPGGCRCFDRASAAPRTWPGRERSSPAGTDAASRRDHLGHRPDHGASGHRAFGHLRRVFVLCSGAVKHGGPGNPARSACLPMAHNCPGRVRRHVRSWRKPTPHFQGASVGQPTEPCLGIAGSICVAVSCGGVLRYRARLRPRAYFSLL